MANRKPEKPKALRALSSEELRKIYAALPRKPQPIIKTGEPILLWDMHPLDPNACQPTILEPYQNPNGFYFFNRLRIEGGLTPPLPKGLVLWLMDHGGKRPEDFDCREAYRPTEEDLDLVERLYGDRNPPWKKIAEDFRAKGANSTTIRDMSAPRVLELLRTQMLEAEPSAKNPTMPDAPKRSSRNNASVNARMIEIIQKNHLAATWSAQQFATALGCAKSTVASTETWRNLRIQRGLVRQERAAARQRRWQGMDGTTERSPP